MLYNRKPKSALPTVREDDEGETDAKHGVDAGARDQILIASGAVVLTALVVVVVLAIAGVLTPSPPATTPPTAAPTSPAFYLAAGLDPIAVYDVVVLGNETFVAASWSQITNKTLGSARAPACTNVSDACSILIRATNDEIDLALVYQGAIIRSLVVHEEEVIVVGYGYVADGRDLPEADNGTFVFNQEYALPAAFALTYFRATMLYKNAVLASISERTAPAGLLPEIGPIFAGRAAHVNVTGRGALFAFAFSGNCEAATSWRISRRTADASMTVDNLALPCAGVQQAVVMIFENDAPFSAWHASTENDVSPISVNVEFSATNEIVLYGAYVADMVGPSADRFEIPNWVMSIDPTIASGTSPPAVDGTVDWTSINTNAFVIRYDLDTLVMLGYIKLLTAYFEPVVRAFGGDQLVVYVTTFMYDGIMAYDFNTTTSWDHAANLSDPTLSMAPTYLVYDLPSGLLQSVGGINSVGYANLLSSDVSRVPNTTDLVFTASIMGSGAFGAFAVWNRGDPVNVINQLATLATITVSESEAVSNYAHGLVLDAASGLRLTFENPLPAPMTLAEEALPFFGGPILDEAGTAWCGVADGIKSGC